MIICIYICLYIYIYIYIFLYKQFFIGRTYRVTLFFSESRDRDEDCYKYSTFIGFAGV